jgi:putative hydrolase of the HAD superfamily
MVPITSPAPLASPSTGSSWYGGRQVIQAHASALVQQYGGPRYPMTPSTSPSAGVPGTGPGPRLRTGPSTLSGPGAADGSIRLVTFDLYDTLIELRPPRWERLAKAARRLGLAADVADLRAADRVAEDYYTEENGARPIRDRSRPEREAFRLEHMVRWLAAAGLPHDREFARKARQAYISEFEEIPDHRHYGVFADVMPALQRLRAAGLQTAVISNADADVTTICAHLAFAHEMDLIVTSALVGWEKPDPRTFRAAFEPLGIAPATALHIGDQPRSDVAGALAVGMNAVLLDRYDRHPDSPVPRVGGLLELADLVLAR